jgi:dynein heavy chain
VEGAEMAAQLQKCENDILHVLSTSEGNILEDASAISALNNSKEVSGVIKEKQVIASETEKKIDTVRAQYVPVASQGQVLYFCIADLVQIEPTYQYALRWYSDLFIHSIRKSEKSKELNERMNYINNHFMYALYCNICRSLLEKDKLLFSFSLTTRLMQSHGKIPGHEFLFLMTGGVVIDNIYLNPNNSWISEKMWGEICRLSECGHGFLGLRESVEKNHTVWKELYDSSTAHMHVLPFEWEKKLNGLQRLMLLRCFRPDKLILAIQNFVISEMGEKYVKPPTFDLDGCFNDSTNTRYAEKEKSAVILFMNFFQFFLFGCSCVEVEVKFFYLLYFFLNTGQH